MRFAEQRQALNEKKRKKVSLSPKKHHLHRIFFAFLHRQHKY